MTDRENVINDLQDAVNDDWMWQHADFYARTMEKAIQLLKEQDDKDINVPIKIIRCKDCKHHDPEDGRCDSGHGITWNLPRPDDWFCADGIRKEQK